MENHFVSTVQPKENKFQTIFNLYLTQKMQPSFFGFAVCLHLPNTFYEIIFANVQCTTVHIFI